MAEELITLSQVELDEQEIRQQSDCVFEIKRTNDSLQTIVYTILSSENIGKKALTLYKYVEEIEKGKIVGRLQQGVEKQSFGIDEGIPDTDLIILETRSVERSI